MGVSFWEDPYPVYKTFQDRSGIFWDEMLEVWVAAGRSAVNTVLRSPAMSSDWLRLNASGPVSREFPRTGADAARLVHAHGPAEPHGPAPDHAVLLRPQSRGQPRRGVPGHRRGPAGPAAPARPRGPGERLRHPGGQRGPRPGARRAGRRHSGGGRPHGPHRELPRPAAQTGVRRAGRRRRRPARRPLPRAGPPPVRGQRAVPAARRRPGGTRGRLPAHGPPAVVRRPGDHGRTHRERSAAPAARTAPPTGRSPRGRPIPTRSSRRCCASTRPCRRSLGSRCPT